MLWEEIECIRGILNKIVLSNDKDLMLQVSQKLDELINKYYKEIYGYSK